MSNVKKFYPADAAKYADNVIEQALGQYDEVLILGYDADGEISARSSDGLGDGTDVLWLIEQFKLALISADYSG